MARAVVAWTLAAGWMAVIYQASDTPGLLTVPLAQRWGLLPASLPPALVHVLETILRKGAHLVTYAILALLSLWAITATRPRWTERRRIWWSWGLAVAYAVFDEVHQGWVPGRDGRVLDVGIDAAGAALGLWVLHVILRRRMTGDSL